MTPLEVAAWLILALSAWLTILLGTYHSTRRRAAYWRQLAQSRGHTIHRQHSASLGEHVQRHELGQELADTRTMLADTLAHAAELKAANEDLQRRLARETWPR